VCIPSDSTPIYLGITGSRILYYNPCVYRRVRARLYMSRWYCNKSKSQLTSPTPAQAASCCVISGTYSISFQKKWYMIKGDTNASIFRWRQNCTKKVNNGVSKIGPRIKTNIFPRNNSESFTWSAKSVHCWRPNIFRLNWRRSAGNLNLYYFDAI
jgi:hypothetical protein